MREDVMINRTLRQAACQPWACALDPLHRGGSLLRKFALSEQTVTGDRYHLRFLCPDLEWPSKHQEVQRVQHQ